MASLASRLPTSEMPVTQLNTNGLTFSNIFQTAIPLTRRKHGPLQRVGLPENTHLGNNGAQRGWE